MPAHYNTRSNPNWNALIAALGSSDQNVADLVAAIKQQFFIKTASGTYLDNLGANSGVSRPPGVGMIDSAFKQYIPVLAYTPKQVRQIVNELLNIFFIPEATTAFVESGQPSTYALQDGWTLEYTVDNLYDELIHFHAADFVNINAATATEVAAAINRQAKHSNAEDYYNNINKNDYVKIFSNSVGSKGSITMVGGLSNIALQFNGFIGGAGTGLNTQWTVTKVGSEITMQWTGGSNPNLGLIQLNDIVMSTLTGNVGSFVITGISLSNNSISFQNLFGTAGVFTQTAAYQVSFFSPIKNVVYTQPNRAVVWEVNPGEAIVEMPATPPVVKRSLKGAAHINGSASTTTSYNSSSSLSVADASTFPMSGNFWLQEVQEIQTRYFTPTQNSLSSLSMNTRLQGTPIKYSYTDRLVLQTMGDTVAGQNTVTNLLSTAGIQVGQNVFMQGVPSYALVASILGSTVTLDHPATGTGSGITVQFAGNTLNNITPSLPLPAILDENTLTSLSRTGDTVTAVTTNPHDYQVGDSVGIYGSSGIVGVTCTATLHAGQNVLTAVSPIATVAPGQLVVGIGITPGTAVIGVGGSNVTMSLPALITTSESVTFNENLNGNFYITSVTSNSFTYNSIGMNGFALIPGTAVVQRIGFSPTGGSEVIITSANPFTFTRLAGSYIWDLSAPFVLSDNTASLVNSIQAGQTVPLLSLTQNTIPNQGGYVVFDFGLNTQEGPISYLFAPNNTTLVLDPSYVFQKSHAIGASVISIDNFGPHIMSGSAAEYPLYVTNPSEVRITLEQLIQSVASAGIFINFLIHYPNQLYSVLPTYTVT
jgi:hypothetical protein